MGSREQTLFRLTAFWAFGESVIGGILHALHLPFTGLTAGGISILCLSLLAAGSTRVWKDLMQAWLLVMMIKAILSPHSPPTAYLAVSFQAFTAAIFYSLFGVRTLVVLIVCILTFWESALQKLLVLYLFYGNSLPEAIDGLYASANKFFFRGQGGDISMTQVLVAAYLAIHLVAAVLATWILHGLLRMDHRDMEDLQEQWRRSVTVAEPQTETLKRGRGPLLYVLFLLLLAFMTYWIQPGKGFQTALWILLRGGIIILVWFFLLMPLLGAWIRRSLHRKQGRFLDQIRQIQEFFPTCRRITWIAWQHSRGIPVFYRPLHFLRDLFLLLLHHESPA